MPPTTEAINHDHDERRERRLVCGGGTYGADRLNRKMEIAHELMETLGSGLPNGWSVNAVLLDPFTDDELAPILSDLVDLQAQDRRPDETYRERVALLVLWIAKRPWTEPNRYGAAWAAMFFGMVDHGYRIVGGQERAVLHPPQDFFDGLLRGGNSISKLAAFLRTTFVHDDELRRARLRRRQELDRRRLRAEGWLQDVLDLRVVQRRRSIDLTETAYNARVSARHTHRAARKVLPQRTPQRARISSSVSRQR